MRCFPIKKMVTIDAPSSLESFRRFIMASTCNSFAPRSYLEDPEVFPTREDDKGSIYVEAADEVTLKKLEILHLLMHVMF